MSEADLLKRYKKAVFVWDGTKDHLWHAELCISAQGFDELVVVHPMPHESIYGDVTTCGKADEKIDCERELTLVFDKLTENSINLRGARLRFLYGDRIREVVRFAESNGVTNVLMPRFCQSNFSKWIHGDLNEAIIEQTHCPVVFLEIHRPEPTDRHTVKTAASGSNANPESPAFS